MSSDLLNIAAIKSMNLPEKSRIPVSILRGNDGLILVVSRYGDESWDFYPYIPQENLNSSGKAINWRIRLPDGYLLTSPKHERLLESARDFIWSLFADPIEGKKRPSMSTLIAKFELLLPLLRWMVSQGLSQFRELQGKTMDYVPAARLSSAGSSFVVDSTLHYRLHVVEYLYLQREKLRDGLNVHPWPHETALSLSGQKRSTVNRTPTTEFIPDSVANKLAQCAIEYVTKRASRLLDAIQTTERAASTKSAYCSQVQTDARTEAARREGFSGMLELKKQLIHLRTACYIVIDMFSGIRDSEMMSLELGCISQTRSLDDTTDIVWLRGTIYKTGVRPKKWLVPQITIAAVEVLSRLTEPLRQKLADEEVELNAMLEEGNRRNLDAESLRRLSKRVHTVQRQKHKLFLSVATKFSNSISALSGQQLNIDLKNFCTDHHINGDDSQPYLLHAHQFRRTYARFVARAELGDLITLRDHFGHWSLDMTMYYVDGAADEYRADTELLEMVSHEKIARQNGVLRTYLTSEFPLANGTHWLNEWRSNVRTAANKEALIAEYAGTLTLNGTGHSWCVGNAKGMGCGGLCVFEAQLCVDCHYGIIGPEHRPVWAGIRDQQKEALALDDIGPGGKARTLEILGFAEKVLKRLDGESEK